jgi:hypothetical protein
MNKKEFERLKPGDMIQSKSDPKWAFIVSQNFGDHLTAVRTIEIRSPEEWDMARPSVAGDPVKIKTKKDSGLLKEAAKRLHDQLEGNPWYQVVGIGDNQLIVYTLKPVKQTIFEFEGFDVEFHNSGEMTLN